MQHIDWRHIWNIIREPDIYKYVITVTVFVLIFVFAGEQSLIKSIKRSKQIHETERAIQASEKAIEKATLQLQTLDQIDSLEQYAREHYLMHKENEEIFLVEE